MTPSYESATHENGKVLALERDIIGGQLPKTANISPEWLEINACQAPTAASLKRTLDTLPPGVARVTKYTPATEEIIIPMVFIEPLEIV